MHADRRRAESFGGQADRYDRSRPTYPDALFDTVLGPTPQGIQVLDVGCGTGIAARAMTAQGAHVVGVEIDPRMAEIARRYQIEVEVGRFEDWDPDGRTFDLLTAGQAWHWVEPLAGAQKAAQLLRPGGRLALFWNIGDPPADLSAALDGVYSAIAPGADNYSVLLGYSRHERYPDHVEAIGRTAAFSDPVLEYFGWERTYTREEWLDQLPTHSDHAALDPDTRDGLLDMVGEAIDRFGGRFDMHYETLLIRADRAG